ncbi:LTA synthase family protein [Azoarcus olearius]|uniref:LTA synthase family protein n=1 Tax=Azoarcus sp. (strain BH72) TaxID=418699 RepID=UPI0014709D9F|nr:LTA synthase family protein [Azoarcus olearius]
MALALGLYRLMRPTGGIPRWLYIKLAVVELFIPIATALVVLLSHHLWMKTGSFLSPELLSYSVENLPHVLAIAQHEAGGQSTLPLLLVPGAAVASLCAWRVRGYWKGVVGILPVVSVGWVLGPVLGNEPIIRPQYSSWHSVGYFADFLFGTPFNSTLNEAALGVAPERIYIAPSAVNVKRRPNILFITLESTRASEISPWRSGDGEATPFIAQLARNGAWVRHAYTTNDHTSKALVGIICGMYAHPGQYIVEANPGELKVRCLPEILKDSGYRSLFIQSAMGGFERRKTLVENMGFEQFIALEDLDAAAFHRLGYFGIDDKAMIPALGRWIKAGRGPFFAHLLTVVTHHPYAIPGEEDIPEDAFSNDYSLPQAPMLLRKYKRTVAYADTVVRDLFGELERLGVLDDTIVVITGDHGEGFGEHGLMGHNKLPYEEGVRVPLLIHYPKQIQSQIIEGARQHLDILPTILELLQADWQGVLPGRSLFGAPQEGVLTQCWAQNQCMTWREGDEKVLYFYGKEPLKRFDVVADPFERNELPLPDEDEMAVTMRRMLTRAVSVRAYWESAGD